MTRYVCLHVLHTYPYVNLNRDDTGAPKTMLYGGTTRVRVSSQSLKRAARKWAEEQGLIEASTRTRSIGPLLAQRVAASGVLPAPDQANAVALVANEVKSLSGGGKDTLAFFAENELQALTTLADSLVDAGNLKLDAKKKDEATKEAEKLVEKRVADVIGSAESAVALFGRMFANRDSLNTDGAVQVAHAFTVQPGLVEQDYFTAVEDWKPAADDTGAGAGHLATNDYGSGTFYKYANIGVDELLRNVGGDVEAAKSLTSAFVRSFLLSTPTGKINTTAGGSVPDLVYLAVEERQPQNLSAAFEQAVTRRGGVREEASARLGSHNERIRQFLGSSPITEAHVTTFETAEPIQGLGQPVTSIDHVVAAATDAFQ